MKKLVSKNVGSLLSDGDTLLEIMENCKVLIEKYGHSTDVSVEGDYDNCYEVRVYASIPETDSEERFREEQEEKVRIWQEDQDKLRYIKLKKKYETDLPKAG